MKIQSRLGPCVTLYITNNVVKYVFVLLDNAIRTIANCSYWMIVPIIKQWHNGTVHLKKVDLDGTIRDYLTVKECVKRLININL